MPDFVIGNDDFGKSLALAIACEYREFKEEYYPDGEPCPRIMADYEEIKGKNLILATRMTQKPTKEKVALYLHNSERVLGALTSDELYNANAVDLVFPYFWLGRQDHNPKTEGVEEIRKRDRGKDMGYKTVMRTFAGLGARRIITFDPHFYRQDGSFTAYDMEILCLSGVHALARYFENKVGGNTVVISPDMGSSDLSNRLAGALGLKSASLTKKRISETCVEAKEVYDAKGLDLIVVDDIISTAGTLNKAIDNLHNAGSITVACIHPVLPQTGYDRLIGLKNDGKINDVVGTDTINSDVSKASVVPEIVNIL
jgi:ribose-phosphate pyrophosphokinase